MRLDLKQQKIITLDFPLINKNLKPKYMKRFQQLLSSPSQNQYGLQYKAIKPTKNLFRNIQNSYQSRSVQNPQTVQVYLKSDQKKSIKTKLNKKSKLEKLKEIIEERLSIPFEDQLIYLNGREISVFSSINLNQKQILHIVDRKNIVRLTQSVLVSIKVYIPNEEPLNGKIFYFSLHGGEKISELKNLLLNQDDFSGFGDRFEFNFLQSGRILSQEESFTENLITKSCDITCLMSENEIQTKFVNQCQQIDPEKAYTYKRIQSPKKLLQSNEQTKEPQFQNQGLKFSKPRSNLNKFLIGKGNFSIDKKISNHQNDSNTQTTKHNLQSESNINVLLSGSGFKKKKPYQAEQDTDDSHLLKKIVVHKSRQEIQKIASESSLINLEINQVQEEQKSVVSSSSSEEKEKEYIPIRQQKEYRPCPLIPQRKMAPSEKIKINMELQKLFGFSQESKTNLFLIDQPENNQSQPNPHAQTTRSRVIIKNPNMRNSIGAKDSFLRIVKDRRPSNRYAEKNLEED